MLPSHKAKEKKQTLKITAGQQKLFHFRTVLYKKYHKLTFISCSFAKKVDQRGLSFSHFLIQTPNVQVSQYHVWLSKCNWIPRARIFVSFGCIALSAPAQVKP